MTHDMGRKRWKRETLRLIYPVSTASHLYCCCSVKYRVFGMIQTNIVWSLKSLAGRLLGTYTGG